MVELIQPFKSDMGAIPGTMCPILTKSLVISQGPGQAAVQVLPVPCHRGCKMFDESTDDCSLKLRQPQQPVGLCGVRFPGSEMSCQLATGHTGEHCSDRELIKAWAKS